MASSPSWPGRSADEMDPSMFLQFSPPNGLPQESKLATYMNRNSTTPTHSLNQAMGTLNIEPSPSQVNEVMLGDFVPMNYYNTSPNMLPDTPENSPPTHLPMGPPGTPQVHQENVGGTTYFYATNAENLNASGGINAAASIGTPDPCMGGAGLPPGPPPPNPYASQMFAGNPPHMTAGPSKPSGLASSFYMPDTIRAEIFQRSEENYIQREILPYPDLPQSVDMYTDLIPLENWTPHSVASAFRATHRQNGEHYALRRLHAYSSVLTKKVEMWKPIDHPNLVRLYDHFSTGAFGDNSLILVYEYHPMSLSLIDKYKLGSGNGNPAENNAGYHDPFSSDPDAPRPYTHQKNAMLRAAASGSLLPEAVLWSVLVQITAGLRIVHIAGLAFRNLDASKVIINGSRVRLAWCGSADALLANQTDVNQNTEYSVLQAQQDDLTALGRIAMALACRTMNYDNFPASMDLIARSYSPDVKNFLMYLLSPSQPRRNVNDLMPMIGARFYTQVEALERRADALEDQLAREFDNGRLMRILVKLGVINERPELNMDVSWSETGDRYMLKLFRDYIFHSVTEDGRPWIDLAHVVYCLNQLDGGSNNKVELMSRDEQSVLIVSYGELKHCLQHAFDEVMSAASGTP